MLPIHVDKQELWDYEKEQFFYTKECDVKLEHSLVSISEWEKKYHRSFIDSEKTIEETLDYIKMMVVEQTGEFDPRNLTREQVEQIGNYINDSQTATTFSEEDEKAISKKQPKGKFTTSEEIYSWMVAQGVPFECEKWHLNRLIVLIKICAIHNKPDDKKKKGMTSSDLALRRAKMEAARKRFSSKP